jgi:ATP-binding cassette, subfamily B, bacterial PglK
MFTRIWKIFSSKDRYWISVILFLMIVGACLEVAGIGAVIPLVMLILNPNAIQEQVFLKFFYQFFNEPPVHFFIIGATATVIGIYTIKNLFLFGIQLIQSRFMFDQYSYLSNKIFKAYLNRPYTYHIQCNTAELLRNIGSEVHVFVYNILIAGMYFLAEIMVFTAIFFLLLWADFYSTLFVIGFLGGSVILFYTIIHKKLKFSGEERQFHAAEMNKQVIQGLGGIKETKVLGREKYFADVYSNHLNRSCEAARYNYIVQQTPRLFIEVLVISLVLGIIISLILQGHTSNSIIATISLFTLAATRLMPSINRMMSAITTIKYSLPSLEIIKKDLSEIKTEEHDFDPKKIESASHIGMDYTLEKSISFEDVTFFYAGTSSPAVQELTLNIRRGESVAFVGYSGAGKTTIIDLILGLFPPSKGRVLVDGKDIKGNLESWQRKIGYIPQTIYLCDDSIRNNIGFGLHPEEIDEESVKKAVEHSQLEQFIGTLPEGLNTVVGEAGVKISGGQRQRIGIARALYYNPSVLIMDEATAALDNQTEKEIMTSLNRLSGEKTLIMIAHRLSTVRDCDTIFFLEKGHIVASGSFNELSETNADFRRMANI